MTGTKNILLVDDDRSLSPLVKEYLEAKDFQCSLFHNAFDALDAFKKTAFTLCILDIRMPMKSGLELAEDLKVIQPDIPFLFLTGQTDKEDRIKGLEAGADDYITKPFSMQELYLRVQAILRRVETYSKLKSETAIFQIGRFKFNASTREISQIESKIKLSAIEARLLKMFCDSSDGIILRDTALRQIWDDENSFRERSLNVYVSKLRQYFKEDPNIEILNIHGTGYQLISK
ncbi:MAG: response regulator transcription factor [Saprospiraceae bacterium]|nr:response regulator transcription factor [Saprospiraceae bacterium]